MADCTRERALSIAIEYLGEQYSGKLKVKDEPLHPGIYRCSDEFDNSWVIRVPPIESGAYIICGDRYIIISKKTGTILFDGTAGD